MLEKKLCKTMNDPSPFELEKAKESQRLVALSSDADACKELKEEPAKFDLHVDQEQSSVSPGFQSSFLSEDSFGQSSSPEASSEQASWQSGEQLQFLLARLDLLFEKRLTSGRITETYLVKKRSEARSLVLRVLKPPFLADPTVRRRFERVYTSLSRLNHRSIMPVFAGGLVTAAGADLGDAGVAGAVSELRPEAESAGATGGVVVDSTADVAGRLVDGVTGTAAGFVYLLLPYHRRSLKLVLKQLGRFQEKTSLQLLYEIAQALAYAHEHGVVHGGIEPDDVFLKAAIDSDKSLEVIVSDFGMNRVGADAVAPGAQVGTGESFGSVRYMSPEQCRGQKPDARSDVYSLACLAFEMLTGEVVYAMGSQLEAMLSQADMERDLLIERLRSSGVSEGTIELLSSMLARESKDRPADMKVVAARLKALWQTAPSSDVSLGELLAARDLDDSKGEAAPGVPGGRWVSLGFVAAGAVFLFAVLPALCLLFVELVGGASTPEPSPVQSREFQEKLRQARGLAEFLKNSDSGPSTRERFASIARQITSQLLQELQSEDEGRRSEAAALLARPVLRLKESNSFAQDVWILRQALTYLSEPRHYAALFDAAASENNSQARKQLFLVLGFLAANDDFAANYLLEAADSGGAQALLPAQISAAYRESFPDKPMGNLEFGLLEILQTTSNQALIDSITESLTQPGGIDSPECLDVLQSLQGHRNRKIAQMAQQRLKAANARNLPSARNGQGQ